MNLHYLLDPKTGIEIIIPAKQNENDLTELKTKGIDLATFIPVTVNIQTSCWLESKRHVQHKSNLIMQQLTAEEKVKADRERRQAIIDKSNSIMAETTSADKYLKLKAMELEVEEQTINRTKLVRALEALYNFGNYKQPDVEIQVKRVREQLVSNGRRLEFLAASLPGVDIAIIPIPSPPAEDNKLDIDTMLTIKNQTTNETIRAPKFEEEISKPEDSNTITTQVAPEEQAKDSNQEEIKKSARDTVTDSSPSGDSNLQAAKGGKTPARFAGQKKPATLKDKLNKAPKAKK